MKMEINEKNVNGLKAIATKYGLDMLLLFGSQATGRIHSKSDVDFGFTSSHDIDLNTRFKIENEMSKLLKRDDIEFVNLRHISPVMKKIISEEAIVLYEKVSGIFDYFCMYAFKLYVETRQLREYRYQSLKNFAYGTSR